MNLNLKIRNSMDFKVSLGGFGGSKGGGSQDKVGQAMVICDSAKKCVVGNASFTADIEG